jgi:hypothetical protein
MCKQGADLQSSLDALRNAFQPKGYLEELLVKDLAALDWRRSQSGKK